MEFTSITTPTPRRLTLVVQSPLLFWVMNRNGEATFPKGPTIRPPMVN